MKKLNAFYILGSVGMTITAILQIFMSLVLALEGTMNTFIPMYLTWLTFLIIGTGQLIKTAKNKKSNK